MAEEPHQSLDVLGRVHHAQFRSVVVIGLSTAASKLRRMECWLWCQIRYDLICSCLLRSTLGRNGAGMQKSDSPAFIENTHVQLAPIVPHKSAHSQPYVLVFTWTEGLTAASQAGCRRFDPGLPLRRPYYDTGSRARHLTVFSSFLFFCRRVCWFLVS